MLETLTVLVAAHVVVEFAIRPPIGLSHPAIALRGLACAICVVAITGSVQPLIVGSIVLAQLLSDLIRSRLTHPPFGAVLADQAAKFALVLGLWIAFPDAYAQGLWGRLAPDTSHRLLWFLSMMTGAVANLQGGAALVPLLTDRFARELRGTVPGLKSGGLWIGWLERALVMLLVLANQITAVGFLVTAKSILRFGEIKDARQRRLAEYIIIGTFLSFGWALLVSLITAQAMAAWK
jgi:hypothetical protein